MFFIVLVSDVVACVLLLLYSVSFLISKKNFLSKESDESISFFVCNKVSTLKSAIVKRIDLVLLAIYNELY